MSSNRSTPGASTGGGRTRPARPAQAPSTPDPERSARARFLTADPYRVEREWKRYEGTPQRDLFRELRFRFLRRNAAEEGWVVDVGAGPGRFTSAVGGGRCRRVALDLSREMLLRIPPAAPKGSEDLTRAAERVVGDAARPPLARGAFAEVAVVGNAVGFAGESSRTLLAAAEDLVSPGGILVVEVAPGPGERSRYLHRLPPGSVARLLAAPPGAVVPRVEREGFSPEPRRHRSSEFDRLGAVALQERWKASGWELRETSAVAPCLGADPARLARIRPDPKAWENLLRVEEEMGRRPGRWSGASAVLLAARRALRE